MFSMHLSGEISMVAFVGCVNVVCSDKTGTLTENLMEVTDIYTASCQHAVVINGASEPQVMCNERTVTPETHPDIVRVVEVSNVHPCYSQVLLTIKGYAMHVVFCRWVVCATMLG